MMNTRELFVLERSMRDQFVLSVYLAGGAGDPGNRDLWRIELKDALARIERGLVAASHRERELFAQLSYVIEAQAGEGVQVAGHGWLAFAAEDGRLFAENVSIPVPTSATWQRGAFVAPYLRLLPFAEPVLVVIADRRKARLFRQAGDSLEEFETVAPVMHEGPESRARGVRLGKMHAGVRGATGADDLSRVRRAERLDLARHVAARVTAVAGLDTPVLVGGTPEIAHALHSALVPTLRARAVPAPQLTHRATNAEIADAARAVAPRRLLLARPALLSELEEAAGAHRRGVVGASEVSKALIDGTAREVLLSRKWTDRYPAAADQVIKAAVDGHVPLFELAGAEGDRLDALGGLGARLRYVRPVAATSGAGITSG